jgi:ribose transport system ATP-binding protein
MTSLEARRPPRLEMRGIAKAFGGVPVLTEVDYSVEPGEVSALLGSNGAGKSTLMKILTGLYARDAGDILVDGAPMNFRAPRNAVAAGVRFLPQEISIMPEMTVAENIFLADLPLRAGPGFSIVDQTKMNRQARDLLGQLGFGAIAPETPVKRLSVASQRIVEVARALAGEAKVLIMDEPTASLSEREAKMIFQIIRRLKEQSVAVVYISHYLNEVFEIADRIVVLRDGRNAGSFETRKVARGEVLHAMLGKTAGDLYAAGGRTAKAGSEILAVEALSVEGKLERVSFALRAGEIFGAFGLIGSGVEVLGRALYGALGEQREARVTLAGRAYRPSTPAAGKAAGVGFVAAERKKEGLLADLTLRENIAAPFWKRLQKGMFVSRAAEAAQAERWIRDLDIRARGPEQTIRTLSGGNQQKVCIARWLVDGMRLVILEEPTRGVDVGARREIYLKLRQLADRGYAILALSSDAEEIAGLCDRSIVLDRGRVAARFEQNAAPSELMAATASEAAMLGAAQGPAA